MTGKTPLKSVHGRPYLQMSARRRTFLTCVLVSARLTLSYTRQRNSVSGFQAKAFAWVKALACFTDVHSLSFLDLGARYLPPRQGSMLLMTMRLRSYRGARGKRYACGGGVRPIRQRGA